MALPHCGHEYVRWLLRHAARQEARHRFQARLSEGTDLVHIFVARKSALTKELIRLRKKLRSDSAVWVSWPKKASKVPTDISEDTIREIALPLGFVDIKVCAVSDVWSGLKLVIRKELR
ncbi:MAG: DUF3052 family protein [Betaproteobacteria bacterium]|nr:MAG: DUF3052 family protein [Betaproteobacteria bacterium]